MPVIRFLYFWVKGTLGANIIKQCHKGNLKPAVSSVNLGQITEVF